MFLLNGHRKSIMVIKGKRTLKKTPRIKTRGRPKSSKRQAKSSSVTLSPDKKAQSSPQPGKTPVIASKVDDQTNLGEGSSNGVIHSVSQPDLASFLLESEHSFLQVTDEICVDSCEFQNRKDVSNIQCSMCMSLFHPECLKVKDKGKFSWHCLRCRQLPDTVMLLSSQVTDLQNTVNKLLNVNNVLVQQLTNVNGELVKLRESKVLVSM